MVEAHLMTLEKFALVNTVCRTSVQRTRGEKLQIDPRGARAHVHESNRLVRARGAQQTARVGRGRR